MAIDQESLGRVHTTQMTRFGRLIAGLRQQKGITQDEMGSRLGISRQKLARIERRPELASFELINRIAEELGERNWRLLEHADKANVTPHNIEPISL